MSDSDTNTSSINDQLSKTTSIFGLRLWVVLGICVGALIVILIFLLSLYFTSRRNHRRTRIPVSSLNAVKSSSSLNVKNSSAKDLTVPSETKEIMVSVGKLDPVPEPEPGEQRIQVDIGKGHRILYPGGSGDMAVTGKKSGEEMGYGAGPEVSHLGWGHWYTLRELEESTNGFADENVIGEGGYGIVYKGVLEDGSSIAVKNLLNNRGQAEKEFKVEVEAIGRVRHKNLVRLLGYCVEGAHRMLVYEYVNNGNLEQWLHGDVGSYSPLTWDIRMNIVIGTAKGLTYLHEGLEPKVVHRDIKSSNILLDKQWNAKLSDFGLAKLLVSERNYVTTRVMGTFGYVAPEYASTGMLNERSDVYSFGILIMEVISGRNPVDYSRPAGEVNLVEWLKTMVTNRNTDGVLDPKMQEKPPSRALKRALLVALRCVDPNAQKRPKMSQVIHMLEADDFPFRDDRRGNREYGRSPRSPRETIQDRLMERGVLESGDSSGYESGAQTNRSQWRNQKLEEHPE